MRLIYLHVILFFIFSSLFNQVIPSLYLKLFFDFDEPLIQILFTSYYTIILENDYRYVARGVGVVGDLPPALFVATNTFRKFTY